MNRCIIICIKSFIFMYFTLYSDIWIGQTRQESKRKKEKVELIYTYICTYRFKVKFYLVFDFEAWDEKRKEKKRNENKKKERDERKEKKWSVSRLCD